MYCYEFLSKYIVFFINKNKFAPHKQKKVIKMDTTHNSMKADDNEAYHADKSRIGKSGLDLIHKSPAHYYAKYLDPNREREKQTPALLMGSAVHMAVFEPQDFMKKFVVINDTAIIAEIGGKAPKQTNRYKEWLQDFARENAGKTILSSEDFEKCLKIKEAVYNHPTAALLLEGGVAEQRVDWLWQGEDKNFNPIQVKCKSKMDWQSHNGFIVDLKTTEDASPAGFGKSIFNYRYDVQGAFYTDAYRQATGNEPRGFIFIAVEKSAPYAVALYYLTPEQIARGRREYEADLRTYHECLISGEFPAYGIDIKPAQLPAWAYRN
jgi:exodeoxyribonuclease VIII